MLANDAIYKRHKDGDHCKDAEEDAVRLGSILYFLLTSLAMPPSIRIATVLVAVVTSRNIASTNTAR